MHLGQTGTLASRLPPPPVRVTLAAVPYYLERRRVDTRTQVTPCWLREEDAQAALGDMEALRVASGWWASQSIFPRRIRYSDKRPRELMAKLWWDSEVEREMARYYELCGREM